MVVLSHSCLTGSIMAVRDFRAQQLVLQGHSLLPHLESWEGRCQTHGIDVPSFSLHRTIHLPLFRWTWYQDLATMRLVRDTSFEVVCELFSLLESRVKGVAWG